MAVNGRCRSIEPYAGWICERCDDLAEESCGRDTRVVDFKTIVGCVAAVDAAAGEIDAYVCTIEILRPEARRLPVPVHGLPLRGMRSAGKYDDLVAAALEVPRQNAPHLSASTRNDNAQRTHLRKTTRAHQSECIGRIIALAVPAELAAAAAWEGTHRLQNTACGAAHGFRARQAR